MKMGREALQIVPGSDGRALLARCAEPWNETHCGQGCAIERKRGAGESLWHHVQGGGDPGAPGLHAWPVRAGREWLETVNRAETEAELPAMRRSV